VVDRGILSTLAVLLAFAAAALAVPAPADAAKKHRSWRLESPDGRLAAKLRWSRADAPLVAKFRRHGTQVLSSSIGLGTATRCLPMGFTLTGSDRSTLFEKYTTRAGKRRVHRHLANRLVLSFKQGDSALRIELRASDDGFAYRTTLEGPARRRVTGECAAFTAPPGTGSWLQSFHRAYENPYTPGLLRDTPPGPIGFPALLSTGASWALLTESDLAPGQPATHLEVRAGVPEVLYVKRPHDRPGLATVKTPWRIAVVGSLATIVESDLVEDLARPPSRSMRWSWVRPGRVAWSWWADSASPASFEAQKAYVDFAARMGWEYALVDAGWAPAWIEQLVAYARARGVRVMLWARWDELTPPSRRDALLRQYRAWGVAGVKLDFMESDSFRRMRWYRTVARAAARRKLLVNFHGSTLPRGMSRTWPNVLTWEGVRGAEAYKGPTPVTPEHNTMLPFTRNAVGSMDYTPVTFSATGRRTSAAHELALAVVYESGLQHLPDRPDVYSSLAPARRFLRHVPAAWDATELLGGYPGGSATIARRRGRTWYVGSIQAGAGGVERLPLRFLFPGRRYKAQIIEDDGGGLRTRSRRVTRKRTLRLRVGTDGGYVARFKPLGRRR
jgi:alpha-glucosidase